MSQFCEDTYSYCQRKHADLTFLGAMSFLYKEAPVFNGFWPFWEDWLFHSQASLRISEAGKLPIWPLL